MKGVLKMVKRVLVVAMALVAILATSGVADIILVPRGNIPGVRVPNSPPLDEGAWVTTDWIVHTDTDFRSAAMVLELTAGSIYQDTWFGAAFTDGPPTEQQIEFQATLEFDTWLDNGGVGSIQILGAAPAEIGGEFQEFGDKRIDIAWGDFVNDAPTGNVRVARFTLSSDADGTLAFQAHGASPSEEITIPWLMIVDGAVFPPEPASLSSLLLLGLMLAAWRRC